MNAEQIKAEVEAMKQWCYDNYNNGADTMVECWTQQDYERLFTHSSGGKPYTKSEAWQLLKDVAEVYRERQADAQYYRDIAG